MMAAYLKMWTRAGPAVGIGTLFVGAVTFSLPDTLLLDRYKAILAQHKDGKESPVSAKIQNMAEKVVSQIKLRVDEEAGLEFFTCYGNNPVHKGSLKMNTGAIIGLPTSFNYNSASEVANDTFQINFTQVDWDTPAGRLLQSSLFQSDKAISFVIAREINYANTHHVWVNAILMLGFGWSSYAGGYAVSRILQIQKRVKRWGRVVFYSFFGFTGLMLYILMHDTYTCYRDRKVDRKTAILGQDYLEGGIEYYNKLLQRNLALRTLMGVEGKNIYTAFGNEVSTWRQSHVQISSRRDNLIYLQKALEDNKKGIKDS